MPQRRWREPRRSAAAPAGDTAGSPGGGWSQALAALATACLEHLPPSGRRHAGTKPMGFAPVALLGLVRPLDGISPALITSGAQRHHKPDEGGVIAIIPTARATPRDGDRSARVPRPLSPCHRVVRLARPQRGALPARILSGFRGGILASLIHVCEQPVDKCPARTNSVGCGLCEESRCRR